MEGCSSSSYEFASLNTADAVKNTIKDDKCQSIIFVICMILNGIVHNIQ